MARSLLVASLAAIAAGCTSPVHIGAIVWRSGAASGYGEQVAHGFDLAVEEVNRAGGVRGRAIALDYRDDATNPEVGFAAAKDLVEKRRVSVVLGAVSSLVTERIGGYCEERHVVLVTPSASAPHLTDAGEYVFRTFPSDVLEASAMAEFARDLGLESAAVLAVDNDYGRSLADVFEERFTAAGGVASGRFVFTEGDDASIAAAVSGVVAARARGLYAPAYLPDLATALRLLRRAGVRPVVMGTSSITGEIARLAGPAAEDLVVPLPSFSPDDDDPACREFVARYRAAYGENPDVYAAHAYDTVKLVAAAADRAGSWGADDVRRALLAMDNFEGATGRMSFDAKGDVIQYPRLWLVRGGEFVAYDRFVEGGGTIPVPPR